MVAQTISTTTNDPLAQNVQVGKTSEYVNGVK